MQDLVAEVLASPRVRKNIEFGEPRPGHPEGSVKRHIADLESNLDHLRKRGLPAETLWKLRFLIVVHDSFKAEAAEGVSIRHPQSHASLAKSFAAGLTTDPDLLNMIQLHDEPHAIWQRFRRTGDLPRERLETLFSTIEDWDLFLKFLVIDGCTPGKDRQGLTWFIGEANALYGTDVDETWILQL